VVVTEMNVMSTQILGQEMVWWEAGENVMTRLWCHATQRNLSRWGCFYF